jgi:magnesium and cobalt exporter, CNNM family
MTPLIVFLLGCAGTYLGALEAAFSALVRLPLRLEAERNGRPGPLGIYLDNPVLLFVPLRLLLGLVTALAATVLARAIGVGSLHQLLIVMGAAGVFFVVFEVLLPLVLVGRDPERTLNWLLPSFAPVAQALRPVTSWLSRLATLLRRQPAPGANGAPGEDTSAAALKAQAEAAAREAQSTREERRLLESIVDFGGTLVREVMTPRPDIVAIQESASVRDLRALFAEQEYSRFPVYKGTLDNIAGFVFIKDLVALGPVDDARPIAPLVRPAVVVPETKRVAELLKQFQRQQTQGAIVVDEYGGTAGLVTIEDLLEEIVGEIRDEYDVESEPIVDEGSGRFVFSGKVDIDEVQRRLDVRIEREGFETVGGFLLSHLGRVPAVGERFEIDGLDVQVLDAERRRINKVRISRRDVAQAASQA